MSSIATRVNAERTNRWLLIGAAVLAVLAGALVFVALANFGSGDDDASSSAGSGESKVLVAKQDIDAGARLDEDMFRVETVSDDLLVGGSISDAALIDGQVARLPIRENAQLSSTSVGAQVADDDFNEDLTFKVPDGMRAFSMTVSEDTAVGGLLVPSDHVDLTVEYITKPSVNSQEEFLHVELLFSNVEVLAVAQASVEEQIAAGLAEPVDEEPAATDGDPGVARRPEDFDVNEGARTITMALTIDQVIQLQQWLEQDRAKVRVALRSFGDDAPAVVEPIVKPIYRN